MSSGDRCVGLPLRRHPLSEFLTLSAVLSQLHPVALFHATSAHRILAFRGFPAQSANSPFDSSYSLVVKCAFLDTKSTGENRVVGFSNASQKQFLSRSHCLCRKGSCHPETTISFLRQLGCQRLAVYDEETVEETEIRHFRLQSVDPAEHPYSFNQVLP